MRAWLDHPVTPLDDGVPIIGLTIANPEGGSARLALEPGDAIALAHGLILEVAMLQSSTIGVVAGATYAVTETIEEAVTRLAAAMTEPPATAADREQARHATDVACRTCDAPIGIRCKTRGNPPTYAERPHTPRVQASNYAGA